MDKGKLYMQDDDEKVYLQYCCNISNMPAGLKTKSKIWLEKNGFKYKEKRERL